MDEKINVKIIIGSIRNGRFGDRPARWINDELKNWKDVNAEVIDLKDYPMPLFDSPTSPAMMNMKYPDPNVQRFSDKIKDADAFIIVSPEYNHGYSSALKNALDWLFPEWGRKPVGFVSYGSASGARAIEQLRMVAIELSMVPIRRSMHFGWEFVAKTHSNSNIQNSELFAPMRDGSKGFDHLAVFVDELIWMARALKSARNAK